MTKVSIKRCNPPPVRSPSIFHDEEEQWEGSETSKFYNEYHTRTGDGWYVGYPSSASTSYYILKVIHAKKATLLPSSHQDMHPIYAPQTQTPYLLASSFPYIYFLTSHSLQSFIPSSQSRNLHSIYRLDPFLYGRLNVRHVCQRREIEKHRFEKIR